MQNELLVTLKNSQCPLDFAKKENIDFKELSSWDIFIQVMFQNSLHLYFKTWWSALAWKKKKKTAEIQNTFFNTSAHQEFYEEFWVSLRYFFFLNTQKTTTTSIHTPSFVHIHAVSIHPLDSLNCLALFIIFSNCTIHAKWLKGFNMVLSYNWHFSVKALKCCIYVVILDDVVLRHLKPQRRKWVFHHHLKIPLKEYGSSIMELNHLSMLSHES